MNLHEHYNKLFLEFLNSLKSSNVDVDENLYSNSDKRFGITLIIVPPENIKQNIQRFLNELKKVEPEQYYYRSSDIHITVMSVISCYENFSLTKINTDKYISVINNSLFNINKFSIEFNGVTATRSAIMIKGFPSNNYLNQFRDNLRKEFANSNLEQSLDKRYSIQTAHSTVVRFNKEIQDKDKFVQVIEKYKDYNFGKFEVGQIIFVANDWYQKKEKVKILKILNV